MNLSRKLTGVTVTILTLTIAVASQSSSAKIENSELTIEATGKTGSYEIQQTSGSAHLIAGVAAKVNGHWLHSGDYPNHAVSSSPSGSNDISQLTIVNSGLAGQPELVCKLKLHSNPAYAEINVEVRNTTARQLSVQGIRLIETRDTDQLALGGPESADRILSDSFSEDRPAMAIHDLGDNHDGLYRGVGSQLIYNRESRTSFFVGALTSERWLTVLRLHAAPQSKITAYEVDSTGTTELETENSLQSSPPEDRIELSLPVDPGKSISAEKIMVALGSDYHAQLEAYGRTIRDLHHARVTAPTPIGWWSWTAYYFGLNQGAALTNAQILAQQLKDVGYDFFHLDEGYQFARGEYATTNTTNFPDGMQSFEKKVQALGLTPGIWTAPFEVSERSWIYQNHKDWLVHNAQHQPIHAGYVIAEKKLDPLYILDSTNPGAQDYLRKTYTTLTRDWGIRYIKLDFMDDSAIEGRYFRPNTTAMEAQRIGLKVIREAVGEDVLLDKDGSVLLNPVGIVDCGRISQDTGHTFESSHDAATGIAARYYMNRNFFIGDPDAFTVSRQTVDEQEWHGGKHPLTRDEARVSIALSAVSGGMFEIGDDLPTLFLDSDRMELVRNHDLINMAKLGRASTPVDLMSYAPEDELPSIFVLHESKRQSIVTVFNWTQKERQHRLQFSDLGLESSGHYQITDVLGNGTIEANAESISLTLAPQSVQVLKIVDSSKPAVAPTVKARVPERGIVGQLETLSAETSIESVPVVAFHWDFGDGTTSNAPEAHHAFTHPGTFTVRLNAVGIEGTSFENSFPISVSGHFKTTFNPADITRPREKRVGRNPE
jgi:alpha-galactosidase